MGWADQGYRGPFLDRARRAVDGPADGGLVHARVRSDLSCRPAQIRQADALQPPPQPRGQRALPQPLLQVSLLSGGEGNAHCHRSGHGPSTSGPRPGKAASGFSDTL